MRLRFDFARRVVFRPVLPATFLLTMGCVVAGAQQPGDDAALFGRGQQLFIQHDLAGAGRALAAISDTAPLRIRAGALRMRALLAWRFRHQWDEADQLLRLATTVDFDRAASFAALARMEQERGHFDNAIRALYRGERFTETAADRLELATRFGQVAVARARASLDQTPVVPLDEPTKRTLCEARERLHPVVSANRGALGPARVLIQVALFLGDGPTVLDAWRSYYLTIVGRKDAGVLDTPRADLVRLLPAWAERVPTGKDVGAVVEALARSGLLLEASIAATNPTWTRGVAPAGDGVEETIAYAQFGLAAEAHTNEYYRLMALNSPDTAGARGRLLDAAGPLWQKLSWPGTPPPLTVGSLKKEVEARFNAEFGVGRTAGYPDLHFGHRVIDDRMTVEQYGTSASLRFIALDGMVSNGFQSWAWDYRQQHGGWARTDEIIQVRSAYAGQGLRIWRMLSDSLALRRMMEDLDRWTAEDWERAAQDSTAYLQGLAERLYMQGVAEVREDVQRKDVPPETVADSFLVAMERAVFSSSIVAHEGRHAIDRRLGLDLPIADREFRAKLSEVAFALQPRLAFGGIISSSIGGSTPHGIANRRIMEGLLRWMRAHVEEIQGLDVTRPLLPQLDRLTNDQLRAAMRSMDPLAR